MRFHRSADRPGVVVIELPEATPTTPTTPPEPYAAAWLSIAADMAAEIPEDTLSGNPVPKHLTRRGNYRVECEFTYKDYRETLYFDSVWGIVDAYFKSALTRTAVDDGQIQAYADKIEKAIAVSTPGNRIQLPTRGRRDWFICVDEHVIVACKWNQRNN